MDLGERIKFVRKNNQLNQKDFGNRLGVSQTHISKIEKNIENPSETLIRFITYMFSVDYNWLKNGEGQYHGELGASAEDYFKILIRIRHEFEERARHMNTDSIWEYVDCIGYLEKLLDCFEKEKVNEPCVRIYYKSINRLIFHILLTTDSIENEDAPAKIKRIKDMIEEDIDRMIENYKNMKLQLRNQSH